MRPRKYDYLEIVVSNFGDFDFFDFLPLFQPKMAKILNFDRKNDGKSEKIKISKI